MNIYLPAYDNGLDWEDHGATYSKKAYTSYEEAEKEIFAHDMKIRTNQRNCGNTFYEMDIEKARESYENYYMDNPNEEHDPFYADDPYLHDQFAYIVKLELKEKFELNALDEDDYFM